MIPLGGKVLEGDLKGTALAGGNRVGVGRDQRFGLAEDDLVQGIAKFD
jgi:hypothetical protein